MSDDRNPENETPAASKSTDATAEDSARGAARRGPPPNPLYHPLFLPTLLIAFSLWFGYDGFLTTDPEMLKHQDFNRIMFLIMLPICLWMVPRGIKEFREDQARAAKKQEERNSS